MCVLHINIHHHKALSIGAVLQELFQGLGDMATPGCRRLYTGRSHDLSFYTYMTPTAFWLAGEAISVPMLKKKNLLSFFLPDASTPSPLLASATVTSLHCLSFCVQ